MPNGLQAIDSLRAVSVFVAGEQETGSDLPKPVHGRDRTEIGRARAPDRPNGRAAEQRHDRFGTVCRIPRHAVPRTNPKPSQSCGTLGNGPIKLRVGVPLVAAALVHGDDGRAVVPVLQQVFRVIQASPGKPFGPRHPVGALDSVSRTVKYDAREFRQQLPKSR